MEKGHSPESRSRTPRSKPYRLDCYVPYLLNHIGGRLAAHFAREIRSARISLTQWRVLHTLWHTGPVRLSQLADKANFDISTLSRVVSDLEAHGLVERTSNPRKGRPFVDVTAKGAACVESLLPAAIRLEDRALAGLSPGERLLLVELLYKLDHRVGPPRSADEAAKNRKTARE